MNPMKAPSGSGAGGTVALVGESLGEDVANRTVRDE